MDINRAGVDVVFNMNLSLILSTVSHRHHHASEPAYVTSKFYSIAEIISKLILLGIAVGFFVGFEPYERSVGGRGGRIYNEGGLVFHTSPPRSRGWSTSAISLSPRSAVPPPSTPR